MTKFHKHLKVMEYVSGFCPCEIYTIKAKMAVYMEYLLDILP